MTPPNDAEIVVGVRGEISGGRVVKQSLDDIAVSGGKAAGATDALERAFKKLDTIAGILERQLQQSAANTTTLQGAIERASLGADGLTKKLAQMKVAADALSTSLSPIKAALENATKVGETAFDRMRKKINDAVESLGIMRGIIAAIGLRQIVNAVDQFSLLQERVKRATTSTREFEQAFVGLQRVSNETAAILRAE
jgi:uncharacterized phage infection (PIP) family protein YhgE